MSHARPGPRVRAALGQSRRHGGAHHAQRRQGAEGRGGGEARWPWHPVGIDIGISLGISAQKNLGQPWKIEIQAWKIGLEPVRLAKVVVSTMKNTDLNSQTRGLIWVYHRKVGLDIIHVLIFIKPCFKYEKTWSWPKTKSSRKHDIRF